MTAQCNLIIDSCSDLPASVVDREGITLLEFPFFFGEEEHKDDLWRSMTVSEFYGRMRKGEQPSTAQLPISELTDVFTKAAQSGVPTVYISFTAGLSGSFDLACMIRDQVVAEYPEAELYVVDTLLASTAEAFIVYEALRQREKGLTAKEMVAWVEEARYFVNCMFMVDDLESLRRGGRIPDAVAYAGAKLDVKPMLTIGLDGRLSMRGVARGRKKGIRQMAEFYNSHVDRNNPSQTVATGNADCPKDAQRLQELISKENDGVMFLDSTIGPVIGCHVGPDMVSVVFWGGDRREDLSVADRIARRVRGA